MSDLIFSHLQIHTENKILEDFHLVVRGNFIHAIENNHTLQKKSSETILEFPKNYHLVPGFVDMHVHGANGSDVMDGTPEALEIISQALAKEGTTGFLATTMTASSEQIEKALSAVRDFTKVQEKILGAKILGVHLEGPFLSPKKVGAQSAEFILTPKIEYIKHWQVISEDLIKLVTIAPELENSLEFIRYLKSKHIIASLGHTDATFSEAMAAVEAGCTHATHLFNAMRGIHQREPGVVTAALLSDPVMVELILDRVHLHPAIVQMILKIKSIQKIVLVTDSMRAKCLHDGIYDLGGQEVEVKDSVAKLLKDGTLAGSVLKMNSALKNMMEYTHCSLSDGIKMVSENPAKALGIFSKMGSIALNKNADLVVLDDKLDVVMTICGGKICYDNRLITKKNHKTK